MAKLPEDLQPESWHRYFAISANNQAWSLAEQADGALDPWALLDAAHASAWHWQVAGNELNHMRATMLLAQAHALAGLGPSALRYADAMQRYFLARAETPDWETAFTHAIHAHAAHVAGEIALHREAWLRAERAIALIADPEDKAIVQKLFDQIPQPAA